MHSKSKNLNPWTLSSTFHGFLALLAVATLYKPDFSGNKSLDIEILETPKLATQPIQRVLPKAPPQKPKGHEVFGVNRKSATSSEGEQVKVGNTLSKTPDQEKLKDSDPDSLPIPSEEYLISEMPQLKAEVRIPYPPESKQKGIQGAVIMDLLIDSSGKVREVTLVEGPNSELSAAAVQAARNFQFTAARIEEKPVAVRIRYSYRFVLER